MCGYIIMEKHVKRYAIIIRGKVQHIGYRGIIEGAARKMEIKGYVFNGADNSVNIVCEGQAKYVDNFINTLKEFARTDIESLEMKEIQDTFPLPQLFSRVATDEYYEFSRKFDIGLDYLDGIKTDTGDIKSTLGDMNGTLHDVNAGIGDMNGTLHDVNAGIGDMNGTLQDVNTGVGDMKGTLGDMKGSLNNIDNTMGSFVVEQREHNHRMDEHNSYLRKILEKLSEK